MAFENPREFKKVYQSTLERIIKTELDRNYPNSYHIALGTGKENGKTYATINIQISKNPTQDTFYKLESQKGKGILERVRDLRLAKEKKTQAILEKVRELRVFGRNYPQFYHKGIEAIGHLLQTRSGQVRGAFHKEGIGDIDLVWGDDKVGLQKIITKHPNDFTSFGEGERGIINGLSEIIENGTVLDAQGVKTIWYKKDNAYYAVGLSKGWYGKGDNQDVHSRIYGECCTHE